MDLGLTEKMVKKGTIRLQEFRQDIWDEIHDNIGHLPPLAILPDAFIKNILDNIEHIKSAEDLSPYIHDLFLLSGFESRLFSVITDLRALFSTLPPHEQRKECKPTPSTTPEDSTVVPDFA